MTVESIGSLVRLHRLASELTQKELAAKVGVAETTIWRVENDQLEPTLDTIIGIADALGCKIDDLVPTTPSTQEVPS